MCDMKNLNVILCVLLALLAFSGCRSMKTDFPNTVRERCTVTSESELREAILRAGMIMGWNMTDEEPGVISATLKMRDRHFVSTKIQYGADGYSIFYVGSQNMDYSAKDGKLNKNYNRWVKNLTQEIRKELLRGGAINFPPAQ